MTCGFHELLKMWILLNGTLILARIVAAMMARNLNTRGQAITALKLKINLCLKSVKTAYKMHVKEPP
jgi:hypothetical protein